MFEREYREMSFVPRWGILRCIKRQTLAEHSYYVTLYAGQIADAIEWSGNRARLLDAALRHDVEEVYMSDIPGPSKRAMIHDRDKHEDYLHTENLRRFGMDYNKRNGTYYLNAIDDDAYEQCQEIKAIIKVADLLDECFYLATEIQLGNQSLQKVLAHSAGRLQEALKKLPATDIAIASFEDHAFKAVEHHTVGNSIIPTG